MLVRVAPGGQIKERQGWVDTSPAAVVRPTAGVGHGRAGAVITIDAMHTQGDTAQAITGRGRTT